LSWAITAVPTLPLLLAGFLAAAFASFLVTPWVLRYVREHRILDHPDERRVHRQPLPRGGGVAVVVAFIIVGGALALAADSLPGIDISRPLPSQNLVGLFLGAIVATLIGAIDDRYDLRARWQFLGQLGLAGIAVLAGISVAFIGNPFGSNNIQFPAVIGIAFTVVWIVGMINSLNFIDGLDGLSSGIALIAALTLGVLSLTVQVNQPLVAVLCFVLAGALLGFLRWNFHPAVIFQGTAGVMFLGYTLGVLAILGSAKVVVALLVLAVPIVDTFWVIAATFTTCCWTWAFRIARRSCSSTPCARRWA
jgi:UDP-GlcNAc:undecaprenyl-phosphate GlcNAc-1-phosphate transferase